MADARNHSDIVVHPAGALLSLDDCMSDIERWAIYLNNADKPSVAPRYERKPVCLPTHFPLRHKEVGMCVWH